LTESDSTRFPRIAIKHREVSPFPGSYRTNFMVTPNHLCSLNGDRAERLANAQPLLRSKAMAI